MSALSNPDRVRDIVDQMTANGAVFSYKPAESALPPSFNFSLPRGGDRWRCRDLIGTAKRDPALWSALVEEVRIRCEGSP